MADIFRLDGKVAVVVGGGGGIGEALAHGMAKYGAKVVIADIDLPKAEKVAQDIQSKFKSEAAALKFDITDEKSVAQLAEQVVAKFGTVDILVNSQGANLKGPPTEFPMTDWDLMFDVNVKGTVLACREFGKVMIEKKKGKIISLSSVRGIRGTDGGNVGYCATKGAVDMITKTLAAEWAPYNINVNAIGPSLVMTEMLKRAIKPERLELFLSRVPIKRIADPQDIVGAGIFLASPASDFITGQIIYVDGGLTAVA
jgi:NAD(P)-dependent dehydrogenase (short-subunit alcohol dehydrogenase family)